MRAAAQLLAVMFALLICTACGDESQADISGVVDPYCGQMVACEWFDDFGVCRQFSLSATAALTHVYGPECGEAWLDLLDCESSLACDDYLGCQAENARVNGLCF
jgi:hypothetical protein